MRGPAGDPGVPSNHSLTPHVPRCRPAPARPTAPATAWPGHGPGPVVPAARAGRASGPRRSCQRPAPVVPAARAGRARGPRRSCQRPAAGAAGRRLYV